MTAPAIPTAPPPLRINALDELVLVLVAEHVDPYERRPPVALKVFPVRHTSTTCRIGVRQGDRRSEAVLDADQLRALAEHLHDCADLIDPPKEP